MTMKFVVAVSVILAVANAASIRDKRASDQNPKIWDALDQLRGKKPLTVPEIQELYEKAVAGQDFPTNSEIPAPPDDLSKEMGFYADESTQCQGFHRVDANGEVTSYLCPNQSVSTDRLVDRSRMKRDHQCLFSSSIRSL